jgi:hypothetical protein
MRRATPRPASTDGDGTATLWGDPVLSARYLRRNCERLETQARAWRGVPAPVLTGALARLYAERPAVWTAMTQAEGALDPWHADDDTWTAALTEFERTVTGVAEWIAGQGTVTP